MVPLQTGLASKAADRLHRSIRRWWMLACCRRALFIPRLQPPTSPYCPRGRSIERKEVLDKIAPTGGGCFDVFAWRDDDVIFCECKRRKHDRLRSSQLKWIDMALNSELESKNFLVAEWDVGN